MDKLDLSTLTICGIKDLPFHQHVALTHVLSIPNPDIQLPEVFRSVTGSARLVLRFHDIIAPTPGLRMPNYADVMSILEFGDGLQKSAEPLDGRPLVHCKSGISRSTAVAVTLLARCFP